MEPNTLRNYASCVKGRLMEDADRRSGIGASDVRARKNSSIHRRWCPADFPMAVAAAIVSASFAMFSLPGAALAQTGSGSPGFEYVSQESFYEETVVEETEIWEETNASPEVSTGDEQYGDPSSEETLADTGGVAPWVVGVGLAFLAIVGLMILSSGLARRGTRASRELRGNRRGGSHNER